MKTNCQEKNDIHEGKCIYCKHQLPIHGVQCVFKQNTLKLLDVFFDRRLYQFYMICFAQNIKTPVPFNVTLPTAFTLETVSKYFLKFK